MQNRHYKSDEIHVPSHNGLSNHFLKHGITRAETILGGLNHKFGAESIDRHVSVYLRDWGLAYVLASVREDAPSSARV